MRVEDLNETVGIALTFLDRQERAGRSEPGHPRAWATRLPCAERAARWGALASASGRSSTSSSSPLRGSGAGGEGAHLVQELAPQLRVVGVAAPPDGRHGLRVLLAYAAHLRAQVHGFEVDSHPVRLHQLRER